MIDLAGQRFGKLVILSLENRRINGHRAWLCQCDCGNIHTADQNELRRGRRKHCGCSGPSAHATSRRYQEKRITQDRQTIVEKAYYRKYRENAKHSRREFSLTYAEFIKIVVQNCYYCNSAPHAKKIMSYSLEIIVNGIDRLNNNLGYITGNVVSCCRICNFMKNSLHIHDFLLHISKIAHHRKLI